jgi:hypothetical protein
MSVCVRAMKMWCRLNDIYSIYGVVMWVERVGGKDVRFCENIVSGDFELCEGGILEFPKGKSSVELLC